MSRIAAATVGLLFIATQAPAGVPEHPGVSVEPVPVWVSPGRMVPIAGADDVPPGTSGLRYLELDYQIRIDGRATTEFFQTTRRVETQAGLEPASQYDITFDPSFSNVLIHHLEVFRNGEWLDRMDDAMVNIVQREADFSRQLFDGSLSVLFVPLISMRRIALWSRPPGGPDRRGLMNVWWAGWVVAGFAFSVIAVLQSQADETAIWIAVNGVDAGITLVLFAIGMLAIKIVNTLSRDQIAKAESLGSGGDAFSETESQKIAMPGNPRENE